jgi:hypothetical protein
MDAGALDRGEIFFGCEVDEGCHGRILPQSFFRLSNYAMYSAAANNLVQLPGGKRNRGLR